MPALRSDTPDRRARGRRPHVQRGSTGQFRRADTRRGKSRIRDRIRHRGKWFRTWRSRSAGSTRSLIAGCPGNLFISGWRPVRMALAPPARPSAGFIPLLGL